MDVILKVYERQIMPLLSKIGGTQAYTVARKNKALSIGAAVALTMMYIAYTAIRPPRNLRHIPSANNIKLIKAFLSGAPINEIASKITIPAALKFNHGIYVVSVQPYLEIPP